MGLSNPADTSDVLNDIGALDLHDHSRMRVYPQAANSVIRLTATGTANAFGSWTACIAADVVKFAFHVVGVLIESAQAADTYFIQFASSDTPSDDEILGECRIRWGNLAGWYPSLPTPIQSQNIPANTAIWGRVKVASASGYWIDISLALTRHISVTNEIAIWPDWPW